MGDLNNSLNTSITVVDAFLNVKEEFHRIECEYADSEQKYTV